MSKESTPLEALQNIKQCLFWSEKGLKEIDIIEKALKEYERLKKLYKLEEETSKHLNDTVLSMNEEVNKQEEVLRIIKEKRVNVNWLLTHNRKEYNCGTLSPDLTQEEFGLLKEVLL